MVAACTGDADDDSASASDSADSHDTDDGGGGLCGGYVGFTHVGRSWRYEYTGSVTGFTEMTLTDISGTDVVAVSTGELAGTGYESSFEATYYYSCAMDGAAITRYEMTQTVDSGSGPRESELVVTYSEDCPGVRAEMSPGDSWSCSTVGTVNVDGTQSEVAVDIDHTVADGGNVTTDAGSWATLEVDSTSHAGGTDVDYSGWVADGVGAVKGDNFELTEYTP